MAPRALRRHTMAILCFLGSLISNSPAALQAETEQGPHAVIRVRETVPTSTPAGNSGVQRDSECKDGLQTIVTLLKSDAILEQALTNPDVRRVTSTRPNE